MLVQFKHGEWGKWVENKVEFSRRSAYRFISVASEFANVPTLAQINISKLYALLDVSQDDRDKFLSTSKILSL